MNKLVAALSFVAAATTSAAALALPEAHLLRVDPRTASSNGAPILSTLVEIVEMNSPSSALSACNGKRGNAEIDCWSDALEKDGASWTGYDFTKLQANAIFTAKVNGADIPARIDGNAIRWPEAEKTPGIGTAWVIAIDGSQSNADRFRDAQEVAYAFVKQMGPNDMMDIIVFDSHEHQYLAESKWKTFATKERDDLVHTLDKAAPSKIAADRSLFSVLQNLIGDAFGTLGNFSATSTIPMHQALVVLSNGYAKADAGTTGPAAQAFSQYITKGRFPDDNTAQVKTPLPVISVWLPPTTATSVGDMLRNNENQFMQSLANPRIGGFYTIVRAGQGQARAPRVVGAVKKRFDSMYVVKWRLSCLSPTIEQSFALNFNRTTPPVTGDTSFKDVPIGVDPMQWPLDIDVQATQNEASTNPVYPGGKMKVFGTFCWAGEKNRAEAYFIPAGSKPDPQLASGNPDAIKNAVQSLVQQNMRGSALEVGDTFVTFQVPDEDKLLEGSGDNMVAHVIVYDNGARRLSGHDEKSILTLKATKKPLPVLIIAGAGGAVLVIGLLLIVIMKSGGGGGGRGKRAPSPPPAPIIAGGPVPPYGGYGPPPGGGYGPPPYGQGPPPRGGFSPNPP
ncbi:MAG TPA: hypothetical protein VGH28_33370 [Polyangiaceae bacterium]|jgi:hypothetical protein